MRMEEMAPLCGKALPKGSPFRGVPPAGGEGGPIAHKREFMGNNPLPALRGRLAQSGNIQRLGNVGIHTDVQTVQHEGSRAG